MPETPMEGAVSTIVRVFRQYGERKGKTWVLTVDGFTRFVTEQLPDLFKFLGDGPRQEIIEATFQDNVDHVFQEYDTNHDTELGFDEFMKLVTKVIREAYERTPPHKSS